MITNLFKLIFLLIMHDRYACAESESFVMAGPTLIMFFFLKYFYWGPNTTKSRPSPTHQRNDIQMAFHWQADDDLSDLVPVHSGQVRNFNLLVSKKFIQLCVTGQKMLITFSPAGIFEPRPPGPKSDTLQLRC